MKEQKIIKQSGVVPYFIDKGVKKIILITAKNSNTNWIVPKGHIKKGISPQQSAVDEAFEEAGLIGKVSSKVIGSLSISKKKEKYEVDYYTFEVTKVLNEWPERDQRERISVEQDYVKKFILDKNLFKILKNI